MRFTKMHGLGNSYVYVDADENHITDPAALARAMSDRHTGVGGDGLILIGQSSLADVKMQVFNADGSRAQMCGNGIRCVAKLAIERGIAAGPEIKIETDAGVKQAICAVTDGRIESVRVNMGTPMLEPASIPVDIPVDTSAERVVDHAISLAGKNFAVTCVSMGNPHAVVFVESLDEIDLPTVGPQFERASVFPERINTHFVEVESRTHMLAKTWERGSGATRACGTGACAVCVAGVLTDRTERSVAVTLPGGDLRIDWEENGHVYMTGTATEICSGEWTV